MSLYLPEAPLWTAAESAFPASEALRKRFTVTDKFGVSYSMARASGSNLLIPRNFCQGASQSISPVFSRPHDFTFHGELRDNQQAAAEAAIKHFASPRDGVLECATGWGKTVVTLYLIAALGQRVMVVVPKEDLLHQWAQEAMKFLRLDPSQIGIVQGPRCQTDRPFVVAMLHSLAMSEDYPPGAFDDFGLCIVDEVHRVAAPVLQQAIPRMPARRRLGLSATPKRADGRELMIYGHFGQTIQKVTLPTVIPKVVRIPTTWKVPTTYSRGKRVPVFHGYGRITALTASMVNDTDRNNIILSYIAAAHSKGRQVVVFSDLLEHLSVLREAAIKNGVPAADTALYVGGMTKDAYAAAKAAPVILATYGMFKEGTDVPSLDTLIMATPRADVAQAVGRILRSYGGKQNPVVVDLVDVNSKVLVDYASARMRWYLSIGAQVVQA